MLTMIEMTSDSFDGSMCDGHEYRGRVGRLGSSSSSDSVAIASVDAATGKH